MKLDRMKVATGLIEIDFLDYWFVVLLTNDPATIKLSKVSVR